MFANLSSQAHENPDILSLKHIGFAILIQIKNIDPCRAGFHEFVELLFGINSLEGFDSFSSLFSPHPGFG